MVASPGGSMHSARRVVLVIVLVSLNWFRGLMAQDLSRLSDEQLSELLQRRNTSENAEPSTEHAHAEV